MKVKEHEVQGEPGGGLTRVWARGAEKKEHEHQAQTTPRAAFRSVIPSSAGAAQRGKHGSAPRTGTGKPGFQVQTSWLLLQILEKDSVRDLHFFSLFNQSLWGRDFTEHQSVLARPPLGWTCLGA